VDSVSPRGTLLPAVPHCPEKERQTRLVVFGSAGRGERRGDDLRARRVGCAFHARLNPHSCYSTPRRSMAEFYDSLDARCALAGGGPITTSQACRQEGVGEAMTLISVGLRTFPPVSGELVARFRRMTPPVAASPAGGRYRRNGENRGAQRALQLGPRPLRRSMRPWSILKARIAPGSPGRS
jgi:hypothetical protein